MNVNAFEEHQLKLKAQACNQTGFVVDPRGMFPQGAGSLSQMLTAAPAPTEPNLLTCSQELRAYLFELASLHQAIRQSVFQAVPVGAGEGKSTETRDTLEGVLRESCQLAASLVGEARTINAKLFGAA